MRRYVLGVCAVLTVRLASSAMAQPYVEPMRADVQLQARLPAVDSHDNTSLASYSVFGPPTADAGEHADDDHAGHAGDLSHDDGHGHGEEEEHDHEHDVCYEFDFFRPFISHCACEGGEEDHAHVLGHDRHESIYGYHFFHLLRTEHAFIERKVELAFADTKNADDGEVDETEMEFEFFWAINNRLAIALEGPVVYLNPDDGPSTSGFGDLEIALRFVALNVPHALVTVGLNVATPTGDAERGLGAGHTTLTPVLLSLYDFGGGVILQNEWAIDVPVDVDDPANEFIYNHGIGKIFPTCHCGAIQNPTPFIELNGTTTLNGVESGRTVIDVTPGFNFQLFSESNEVALGASFPVAGDQNFDHQWLFAYFRHF